MDNQAALVFSENDYLAILDLLHEVVNAMAGEVSEDNRKPEVNNLALKLSAHAISAYRLAKTEQIELPLTRRLISFIDMASISTIGRAALETYLTFYEIFVSPKSDDDFEFQYCLWHISDFRIFEDLQIPGPSFQQELALRKSALTGIRERLVATSIYKALPQREQKNAYKGLRKRNWDKVIEETGLNSSIFRIQYKYASGFAHSGGMTSGQLMLTTSQQEQHEFAQVELQLMIVYLSKFILDYLNLNPQARVAAARHKETLKVVEFWASQGSDSAH